MADFFTIIQTANTLHKQAMKVDPRFPDLMGELQGQAAVAWNDFEVYVCGHWVDVMKASIELADQFVKFEEMKAALMQWADSYVADHGGTLEAAVMQGKPDDVKLLQMMKREV